MSSTTQRVHELVEGLLGDVPPARGHFTLDRKRTRELAARHLLGSPREYILLLVRAAVRRGATGVRVFMEPDRVRVCFDGDPFRHAELDRLPDAVLAAPGCAPSAGVRELALAVIAARSLAFTMVRIDSSSGDAACSLRVVPNQPDQLVRLVRRHDFTRIELRGSGRGRSSRGGYRVERLLLEQRCRYTPVPLFINGCPISDPSAFAQVTSASVTLEGDGLRAQAGYMPYAGGPAELRFTVDGVWVATEELDVNADGFVVYVQADGLRMDLSQQRIIRDETHAHALEAALGLLEAARKQPDVKAESKLLNRRYRSLKEKLHQQIRRHADFRTYLCGIVSAGGFVGILAFAQVVLSFPVALAVVLGSVAVLTGVATLGHFWKENDASCVSSLKTLLSWEKGVRPLVLTAFKEREHQADYRSFRAILDEVMRGDDARSC